MFRIRKASRPVDLDATLGPPLRLTDIEQSDKKSKDEEKTSHLKTKKTLAPYIKPRPLFNQSLNPIPSSSRSPLSVVLGSWQVSFLQTLIDSHKQLSLILALPPQTRIPTLNNQSTSIINYHHGNHLWVVPLVKHCQLISVLVLLLNKKSLSIVKNTISYQ